MLSSWKSKLQGAIDMHYSSSQQQAIVYSELVYQNEITNGGCNNWINHLSVLANVNITLFPVQSVTFMQIEDLKSSNGSFVNDEKIEVSTLNHLDRLRIGNVELVVEFPEASERPAESAPVSESEMGHAWTRNDGNSGQKVMISVVAAVVRRAWAGAPGEEQGRRLPGSGGVPSPRHPPHAS